MSACREAWYLQCSNYKEIAKSEMLQGEISITKSYGNMKKHTWHTKCTILKMSDDGERCSWARLLGKTNAQLHPKGFDISDDGALGVPGMLFMLYATCRDGPSINVSCADIM